MNTRSRRMTLASLSAKAAVADADAQEASAMLEREQVRTDPDDRRFGSWPLAVATAVLVALIDWLPAHWAAEALGNGASDTRLLTWIFVAGLTAFAALMSHFNNRRERRMFIVAVLVTALLILIEAGLRLRYALVVNDATLFDAALQASVLACISGGLAWMGYVKLVNAEPYPTWKRRLTVNRKSRELKDLRMKREKAESEYTQAYLALENSIHDRVSHDPGLQAAIMDELALSPALVDAAHEAAGAPDRDSDSQGAKNV